MNDAQKAVYAERSRALFALGLENGTWRGTRDCAKQIGETETRVGKLMNGKRVTQLAPIIIRKMEAKLLIEPLLPADRPPAPEQPAIVVAPQLALDTNLVISGILFQAVKAGLIEFSDQQVAGIPYVLTEENFRRLHGAMGSTDIEEMRKKVVLLALLLREVRREFNVVSQNTDPSERLRTYSQLADEVDELYIAIELSRYEIPGKAAARLREMRRVTDAITGRSQDDNEGDCDVTTSKTNE